MLAISYKIKVLILPILLILFYLTEVIAQEPKGPTIALVLSGGGAKGFAHIGVLKVLEAEGIPIDIIVGTSMGSIVGGLYSIGYTAGQIENMAKSEDWVQLFSDDVPRDQLSQNSKIEKQRFIFSLPVNEQMKPTVPIGAIKGQNVLNLFADLTGNTPSDAVYSNFPINFACIGADLGTGKEIIIDRGLLSTGIYSSMTIPGVFLPGEHNGHIMIDGGVVDNFPTDVAKDMGADIIIGVDIRNDIRQAEDIKSMQLLMDQLINFYSIRKDSTNKSYCNIIIRPDITGYNASSFSPRAVDTLVERGIVAAQKALPEIRELKSTFHLTPSEINRDLVKNDSWNIQDITISGDYSLNEKLILDNFGLIVPGNYTYKEIKKAIDRVYGLGCFKRVYFNLIDSGNVKTLNLNIEEEGVSNINVGMRLNNTEALSLLLNYTQRDYKRYFGFYSLTADISSNPGFDIVGEISKKNLPVIGLQLDGKYSNFNIYSEGKKSNSAEIYYGAASVYIYHYIKKHAITGIGVKQEFFKGNFFSAAFDSTILTPNSRASITNVYAYYSFDNFDNFYYPTKGTELYLETSITEDQVFNNINPVALLKMRNVFKLHENYSLLFNLYGRTIFTTHAPDMKQNYVGGLNHEIYFSNHLPFYGIPSFMLSEKNTFIGLMGLRVKIAQKHYVSALVNYMAYSGDVFNTKDYRSIIGEGIGYSYNSKVGPIDFTIGYSDWYKKPTFSTNIGFWF